MSSPAQQNLAYSQLLEYIQTIRDRVDVVSELPDAHFVETHIPSLKLYFYETGTIMASLLSSPASTMPELQLLASQTWAKAYETNELLSELIVKVHNETHPEEPISADVFENPGSSEWQRAYTCATLLVGSSYKITEHSAGISKQQDLCSLCSGSHRAGEPFIRLTCASHHRVHERCLMTMKNLEVVKMACPTCREAIEAPHNVSMHSSLQVLEAIA
ncbi:hypothetical protein CROQUDRAFT_85793 [Cronartium quercuum f. sp. fusiforme G11]|uniref:RING-type domain-containing protein n=1 Tax=Cronartium quercuum f. sp. fusiforme G11 TaxID=708437 RepID=A0A9P6NTQ7_9BASI|nr:hypothetical protein CROQUDRAFT_85793 [Cronartium quercuum f. sp. fusiforme G11]